jgi:hypothetical protein
MPRKRVLRAATASLRDRCAARKRAAHDAPCRAAALRDTPPHRHAITFFIAAFTPDCYAAYYAHRHFRHHFRFRLLPLFFHVIFDATPSMSPRLSISDFHYSPRPSPLISLHIAFARFHASHIFFFACCRFFIFLFLSDTIFFASPDFLSPTPLPAACLPSPYFHFHCLDAIAAIIAERHCRHFRFSLR